MSEAVRRAGSGTAWQGKTPLALALPPLPLPLPLPLPCPALPWVYLDTHRVYREYPSRVSW